MILVSACLADIACRYDGGAKTNGNALRLVREKKAVTACPEMMAGFAAPRPPAEIRGGDGFDVLDGRARVYNRNGEDITSGFIAGAHKLLDFIQKNAITEVWLKEKSPSCGVHEIYDGSFSGRTVSGCGVTCALLKRNGIKVVAIPEKEKQMANQNILIIDDDKNIREVVKLYLRKEGYEVTEAADGAIGFDLFMGRPYDLVLLDIMMPVQDGIETMKKIREKSNIPVIMLTAKDDTFDKVLSLELGADDYVVKPFDPKELVARVKAVIRRSTQEEKTDVLEYPDLKIDIQNYQVIYKGKELQMPPKEIELLHFLAARPNKVFTRDQLLEQVWGFEYFGDSRTVDVHVKRLREKFEENEPWQIKTVWGVGYKFEV